jgi:hypothetical protein
MPKAPNDVSQYFRGDATWAISPGSTATTSTFTCPAFYAAVAGVLIASSPWLQPGDKVFVAGAGKFFVSAKASNTSVTLFNTGDLGNASSGTIASGSEILLVPKEIGESLFSSWTDDFLIPNLGGWYLTGSAGTGAAIFDTTAFTDANHPGCATLVSASTATGYAWMTSSPGYFNINTAGDKIAFRAVIDCAVKPTTVAAANGVFYVGLGTQLSAATQPVDFIGFSFIPATDNYQLAVYDGQVRHRDQQRPNVLRFRHQYLGRHVLHLRGRYGFLEDLHLERHLPGKECWCEYGHSNQLGRIRECDLQRRFGNDPVYQLSGSAGDPFHHSGADAKVPGGANLVNNF